MRQLRRVPDVGSVRVADDRKGPPYNCVTSVNYDRYTSPRCLQYAGLPGVLLPSTLYPLTAFDAFDLSRLPTAEPGFAGGVEFG